MSAWKIFIRGLWEDVPLFRLVLGLCPALAVTTSLRNGLGMGLATMSVLLGSNFVVSLVRKAIPAKIRIPSFIVVIASFVTIVDLVMHGFTPELHKALGIFASKNSLGRSLLDAAGMGLGFTLALCILGSVREILGSGTIGGFVLTPESYRPVLLLILPPGGFIVYGLLIAWFNLLDSKRGGR